MNLDEERRLDRRGGGTAGSVVDSGGIDGADPLLETSSTFDEDFSVGPTAEEAWAGTLPFREFCGTMQKLRDLSMLPPTRLNKNTKVQKQRKLLFPQSFRQKVLEGNSLYPYVRLVVPHTDNHGRPPYNIKATTLADILAQVHVISKDDPQYVQLTKSLDTTSRKGKYAGRATTARDFADVALDVLRSRLESMPAPARSLTLAQVNAWLDRLAAAGDREARVRLFEEITPKITPQELLWLLRIILQDMRLGFKHERVFGAYHQSASESYQAQLNLRKLMAEPTLRDPRVGAKFTIALGRPFSCMRADRLTLEDAAIVKALKDWGTSLYIEQKFDGERIVLHWRRHAPGSEGGSGSGSAASAASLGRCESGMTVAGGSASLPLPSAASLLRGRSVASTASSGAGSAGASRGGSGSGSGGSGAGEFLLFSRLSNVQPDYMEALGPSIRAQLAHVDEAILDGELMSWDPLTSRYLPFSDNLGTARRMVTDRAAVRERRAPYLRFMIFDCVWVAGLAAFPQLSGSLTGQPLSVRRAVLENVLAPLPASSSSSRSSGPAFLEVLPCEVVSSPLPQVRKQRIIAALEKAVERGDEGIMLKNPHSQYELDRSVHWLKAKPEYAAGGSEPLDLLILGGYAGSRQHLGGRIEGADGKGLAFPFCSVFLLGVWAKDVSEDVAAQYADLQRAKQREEEEAAEAAAAGGPKRKRSRKAGAGAGAGAGADEDTAALSASINAASKVLVIGKVGSGYTYDQLIKLNERLAPLWDASYQWPPRPGSGVRLPSYLGDWRPSKDDVPHVVIKHPLQAIVAQIRAGELIRSDGWTAGWVLRFPRLQEIREDKSPREGDTMPRIRELCDRTGGKLGRAVALDGEVADAQTARRKAAKARAGGAAGGAGAGPARGAISAQHAWDRSRMLAGVDVLIDVFRGKPVLIVTGPDWDAGAMDAASRAVAQLGGEPVRYHAEGALFAVSPTLSPNAQALTKPHPRGGAGAAVRAASRAKIDLLPPLDLLHPSYLQACLAARSQVELEPQFVLVATAASRAAMARAVDEWGCRHFHKDAWADAAIGAPPEAAGDDDGAAADGADAGAGGAAGGAGAAALVPASGSKGASAASTAQGKGKAALRAEQARLKAAAAAAPGASYAVSLGPTFAATQGFRAFDDDDDDDDDDEDDDDEVRATGDEGRGSSSSTAAGAAKGVAAGSAGSSGVAGLGCVGTARAEVHAKPDDPAALAHLSRILCRVSAAAADSALGWSPDADENFDADELLLKLPGAATREVQEALALDDAGGDAASEAATQSSAKGGKASSARASTAGAAASGVGMKRRGGADVSAGGSGSSSSSAALGVGRLALVPGSVMSPPSQGPASFVAQRVNHDDEYFRSAREGSGSSSGAVKSAGTGAGAGAGTAASAGRKAGTGSAASSARRMREPASAVALAVDEDDDSSAVASVAAALASRIALQASAEPWKLRLPAPSGEEGGLWRRIASLPAWEAEDRALFAGPRSMFGCAGPTLEDLGSHHARGAGSLSSAGGSAGAGAAADGASASFCVAYVDRHPQLRLSAADAERDVFDAAAAAGGAPVPVHAAQPAENAFRLRRGEVAAWLDLSRINVVLVHSGDAARLAAVKAAVSAWEVKCRRAHVMGSGVPARQPGVGERVHVVSTHWVMECVQSGRVLPVDSFLL